MRPLTDAERQLVEENTGLVYHVAYRMIRRRELPEKLLEDAIAEGMIGLMNAARYFDNELGYQFSTLAETCIRQQILNLVQREMRNWVHKGLSLDDTISQGTMDRAGAKRWVDALESGADTEAEAVAWVEEAVCQIMAKEGKPHYGQMFLENANGRTLEDIARERGVSRQRICKQVGEARKILREKMKL